MTEAVTGSSGPEEKIGNMPSIYQPTPGARELFKAVFRDETAIALFEEATPYKQSRFKPEEKVKFMDYVVGTTGLSRFEAEEIFNRLIYRKYSPNVQA